MKSIRTKKGKRYKITATPKPGWEFGRWVRESDSSVVLDNPHITSSQHDEVWTAHFNKEGEAYPEGDPRRDYITSDRIGLFRKGTALPYVLFIPSSHPSERLYTRVYHTLTPRNHFTTEILEISKSFANKDNIESVVVRSEEDILEGTTRDTYYLRDGNKDIKMLPALGNTLKYDDVEFYWNKKPIDWYEKNNQGDARQGTWNPEVTLAPAKGNTSADFEFFYSTDNGIYKEISSNTVRIEDLNTELRNVERALRSDIRTNKSPIKSELTMSNNTSMYYFFDVKFKDGTIQKYKRRIDMNRGVDIAIIDWHDQNYYYVTQ